MREPAGGPEIDSGGWRRRLWQAGGVAAFALGTVGIFLPLLPTVGFYVLAAFCFGKSNPAWEARLLRHPTFGPHIVAWRERGAIARSGKIAAVMALSASSGISLLLMRDPWRFVPPAVCAIVAAWLLSRPDA